MTGILLLPAGCQSPSRFHSRGPQLIRQRPDRHTDHKRKRISEDIVSSFVSSRCVTDFFLHLQPKCRQRGYLVSIALLAPDRAYASNRLHATIGPRHIERGSSLPKALSHDK